MKRNALDASIVERLEEIPKSVASPMNFIEKGRAGVLLEMWSERELAMFTEDPLEQVEADSAIEDEAVPEYQVPCYKLIPEKARTPKFRKNAARLENLELELTNLSRRIEILKEGLRGE